MKKCFLALLSFILLLTSYAQLPPVVTCWWINNTQTGFAGALTNVQQVNYSSTFVYVKTQDIPSWIPVLYDWPNNPWFAVPMNYQFRFRLNPTPNVGPETKTGYGHIGLWKNGCSIYNPKDAKSYQDSSVWFQNAWYWEHLLGETFDSCIGHPNQSGEYHTHVSPACLWNFEDSLVASPLLGYAFDSYPIYGGYGHADPLDTTSAIIRLKSSYRLRNITDRTTLADGTVLPPSQYGPSIAFYPLGAYMEDYEYVPGLGDLDEYNGRFSITSEYPNGIYTYHTTIGWVAHGLNSTLEPMFPYVLGTAYYGEVIPTDGNTGPGSGFVVISEPVTPYYGITSIDEASNLVKVSVYPNPVADKLMIDASALIGAGFFTCSIYNNHGQLIKLLNIAAGEIHSIDCSQLSNGIYFVKVQSELQSKNFKLIVSR